MARDFCELLGGPGVAEAVFENEGSHAGPLEPVGHQRTLGVPGQHAERASRRDNHGDPVAVSTEGR